MAARLKAVNDAGGRLRRMRPGIGVQASEIEVGSLVHKTVAPAEEPEATAQTGDANDAGSQQVLAQSFDRSVGGQSERAPNEIKQRE
jgi:hypothetical protein